MEYDSSSEYYENQTHVTYGNPSHLYAGAVGGLFLVFSRIPSLLFSLMLISNVEPNPLTSWAIYLSIGTLVAVVGGILLGLSFMALMKRYGKSYGPILFLAIVIPSFISQYSFGVTTPESALSFGTYSLIVNIATSVIIGIGILSVRSQSVNPILTGITGILAIANPIVYAFSGVLLMIIVDPSLGLFIYFLTGFAVSFIFYIALMMLFYSEGRSRITGTLDW